MFPKRQTQRKSHTPHVSHAHTQHHTHQATHTSHAHDAHTHHAHAHHVFFYTKVYSCTYYGRKDHLAKFYYDRLNISNDHVWVHRTNTLRPKKIWVPKSTLLSTDVGTHQGSKT